MLLKGLAIAAFLLAAIGLWAREEITRLMAVNSLFSAEHIIQNFSNMDKLFLNRPMSRGGKPISVLPKGSEIHLSPDMLSWIEARAVTGLVILKDRQIRHESYYLGTNAEDLRISWSVAKSVLASLLGIVLAEGKIASIDDPVLKYAPSLAGSAYSGTTIRDVLTMSSGVAFNEEYLDFWSDINRMGRVLALGGSMDGFAAGLTMREAEPGSRMHYVSIDTHVIGMVIRGATGQDIPDLLETRLFHPLGLEASPYYLTDGEGVSFVLGGLNMPTRDYARLGALIAADGAWDSEQIIPADWVDAMTQQQAADGSNYGFQWWIPENPIRGEVMARGIYGQYIWIDRQRNIVIAVNAADRNFEDPGVDEENVAMFRAIADRL